MISLLVLMLESPHHRDPPVTLLSMPPPPLAPSSVSSMPSCQRHRAVWDVECSFPRGRVPQTPSGCRMCPRGLLFGGE